MLDKAQVWSSKARHRLVWVKPSSRKV